MADQSAPEEALHRELYRRSRDIIRVYNPLDTDFRFKYDAVWYKVPAKGYKDWERYLCEKYFHDISQYIIGNMIAEKGDALLKKRREAGMADFLNKYDENKAVWDYTPRIDDKDLNKQIASEIFVGLVEEFGAELPPEEPNRIVRRDVPLEQEITNEFSKKYVTDTAPTEFKPIVRPIITQDSKKITKDEVSNEG